MIVGMRSPFPAESVRRLLELSEGRRGTWPGGTRGTAVPQWRWRAHETGVSAEGARRLSSSRPGSRHWRPTAKGRLGLLCRLVGSGTERHFQEISVTTGTGGEARSRNSRVYLCHSGGASIPGG